MHRRFLAVALAMAVGAFGIALAQPRAGRVLERVTVESLTGGVELAVRFPFPVQVREGFPVGATKLFAVRIEPLGLQGEERAAAAEREIRAPSGAAGTPVAEVVYDGEMFGGPYLLVVFRRPAVARVRPANDARGLVIAVTEPTGEPEAGRHGGR